MRSDDSSRRLEINHLLAIIMAGALMALGLVMRNNTLNATFPFRDEINGINAQLPEGWLLDTTGEDFVFQAIDPGGRPFKTTLQVSIINVGREATPRNIVDLIEIQGPLRLPEYQVYTSESTRLGDDSATELIYAFVQTEANPFLETEPIVVQGIDLVVKRGNQAIIFTFRDAQETFDQNRFYFDNFLNSVEY